MLWISCPLPGDTKRSGEPRSARCHELTERGLYRELYEMQVAVIEQPRSYTSRYLFYTHPRMSSRSKRFDMAPPLSHCERGENVLLPSSGTYTPPSFQRREGGREGESGWPDGSNSITFYTDAELQEIFS